MIQQIIALLILIFFISKLIFQWRKKTINLNEFVFWLIFWLIAGLLIIFIKPIDKLVMNMGFSSSGINLIFYVAVLFLFYLIFKMRLRIVKMEKDITELSRKLSLRKQIFNRILNKKRVDSIQSFLVTVIKCLIFS